MFEKTTSEPEAVKNARKIYQEAAREMKGANEKEERLMILESWQAFEVLFYELNFIKREKAFTNNVQVNLIITCLITMRFSIKHDHVMAPK